MDTNNTNPNIDGPIWKWQLLAGVLGFGAVGLIFLFYFNRIFAFVITRLINIFTWPFLRVHISFEALQISPLGGRIFFKNFRYHGQNESFIVVEGFLTWRYWLRRVANARFEGDGDEKDRELPCRTTVEVRGVEVFIQNRSPSYDGVASAIQKVYEREREDGNGRGSMEDDEKREAADLFTTSPSSSGSEKKLELGLKETTETSPRNAPLESAFHVPPYLRGLPIQASATKGAVILGNEHTKNYLVATFDNASVRVDVGKCGQQDLFRQIIDVEAKNVDVSLRPNETYLGPLAGLTTGKTPRGGLTRHHIRHKIQDFAITCIRFLTCDLAYRGYAKGKKQGRARKPSENAEDEKAWQGLDRYRDAGQDGTSDPQSWDQVEYAKTASLVITPEVSLSMQWDMPGVVSSRFQDKQKWHNINGSQPPAYELEVHVKGGNIEYGPWADRQRDDLQNLFLPNSFADSFETPVLRLGQTREYTEFNILIVLDEAITVRIPTREESKDIEWQVDEMQKKDRSDARPSRRKSIFGGKRRGRRAKKPEKTRNANNARQPGWLELTVEADTTVKYVMDMFPSRTGLANKLYLDVKSAKMTSSVNQEVLWRAKSQIVTCDLSYPLGWKALRDWTFDVKNYGFELFMLRDHAYLIVDLVADWTSGPKGSQTDFVPFQYTLKLGFENIKVHLNTNDSNIVDKPDALDQNTYICISALELNADVTIPLIDYQPTNSAVKFDGKIKRGAFTMELPPWHTYHSFADSKRVADIGTVDVTGYYAYRSATSAALTDTLVMDVQASQAEFTVLGVAARLLVKIKDNYFGDDIHFQTLAEYQTLDHSQPRVSPTSLVPTKVNNDLDVLLKIHVEQPVICFPSNIYCTNRCVVMELPIVDIDLRVTNYYFDMEGSFSAISISNQDGESRSAPQAVIDSLMLSGHRLFGLPPAEPAYVATWDVHVGTIRGQLSMDILQTINGVASTFAFSFQDAENKLPGPPMPPIHDVTFVTVFVEPIELWLALPSSASVLRTSAIEVKFDDLAGDLFSTHLSVIVPSVCLAILEPIHHRSRRHDKAPAKALAMLQTSLKLRMIETSHDFEYTKRAQQLHIAIQDSRTSRTPWLIVDDSATAAVSKDPAVLAAFPPASIFPPAVPPLQSFKGQSSQTASPSDSICKSSLRPTSSFLSLSPSTGRSPSFSGRSMLRNKLSRGSLKSYPKPTQRGLIFEGKLLESTAFPLVGTVLPDDVLPSSSGNDADDSLLNGPVMLPAGMSISFPENAQATILVDTDKGIKIFCTPGALEAVEELIGGIQSQNLEDVLDVVHLTSVAQLPLQFRQTTQASDISLRIAIPEIALRVVDDRTYQEADANISRVHEISLINALFLGRFDLSQADPQAAVMCPFTLEFSLDSLYGSSTREGGDLSKVKSGVALKLESINCWLMYKSSLIGRVLFGSLDLLSLDDRVDRLSLLITETLATAKHLEHKFRDTVDDQRRSLRKLVALLTERSANIAEPAFRVQPFYALRVTTGHIRATDTWKILSRLRETLRKSSLSTESLETATMTLNRQASNPGFGPSELARQFTNWHQWDLEDAGSCALMRAIFADTAKPTEAVDSVKIDVSELAIIGSAIVLCIDPAGRTNTIKVSHPQILLNSAQKDHSTNPLQPELTRITVLQMRMADLAVQLDWSILNLGLSIMRELEGSSWLVADKEREISAQQEHQGDVIPYEVQFLTVVQNATLEVTTPNLILGGSINTLTASVIVPQNIQSQTPTVALLAVKETHLLLSHDTQKLFSCDIVAPNVNFTRDQIDPGKMSVGAFASKLSVAFPQSILGLIGVADMVIHDELQHVSSMMKSLDSILESKRKPEPVPSTFGTPSQPLQISVSLALIRYDLKVALLASLSYEQRAEHARATIRLNLAEEKGVVVDADVLKHSHHFWNRSEHQTFRIAAFPGSPINIYMDGRQSGTIARLSGAIDLAPFSVDASSVHGLLTTLYKSEVSAFKDAVERDTKTLTRNFEQTIEKPKAKTETEVEPTLTMLYNVKVCLHRLELRAKSTKNKTTSSRILLGLDRIFFNAYNHEPDSDEVLLYSEMRGDVRKVSLALLKHEANLTSPCGDIALSVSFVGSSLRGANDVPIRNLAATVQGLKVNLYSGTAALVVDVLGYLQERFAKFSLADEIQTLRIKRRKRAQSKIESVDALSMAISAAEEADIAQTLLSISWALKIQQTEVAWRVRDVRPAQTDSRPEDLVLSIQSIDLATRRGNTLQLVIANFQVQMVSQPMDNFQRSQNSALLPELVFNVAYVSVQKERRIALQAVGKSFDLKLTSDCVVPMDILHTSISTAVQDLKKVVTDWTEVSKKKDSSAPAPNLLGNQNLASLLIDVDFAGATFTIQERDGPESPMVRMPGFGRYGQIQKGESIASTLRSPGIAIKLEYKNLDEENHFLNAGVKVEPSTNVLRPEIVPLVIELSSNVQEVMAKSSNANSETVTKPAVSTPDSTKQDAADLLDLTNSAAILGKCKLNLGLHIGTQAFGLTCQPYARVAARASIGDIHLSCLTVQDGVDERFFAVSLLVKKVHASMQHDYSRDAMGSLDIESLSVSLLNSRHVSNKHGLSAIMKLSPIDLFVNVRQWHDYMLFAEIWYPTEARNQSATASAADSMGFDVTKYAQMTAAAFPWDITISFTALKVAVDFGQTLGKLDARLENLWVSSKKDDDGEQNLTVGLETLQIDSKGRASGMVTLTDMRARSSIDWPKNAAQHESNAIVQLFFSIGEVKVKAGFDFQTFLAARVSNLRLTMFNVASHGDREENRLVCMLTGDTVQVFVTALAAAQSIALYQAADRLVQEKEQAFAASIREFQKSSRRLSSKPDIRSSVYEALNTNRPEPRRVLGKLDADVTISLKVLNVGAYRTAFDEQQIFKLEATKTLTKFSVANERRRINSQLGLSLGQVRVALSSIVHNEPLQAGVEVTVDQIVRRSTESRGGTILKVPSLTASMETWQPRNGTIIEYIFKSAFEGKVEVGWNYSRIRFIQTMWDDHVRALTRRMGKPLPKSAVRITSVSSPGKEKEKEDKRAEDQKAATSASAEANAQEGYRAEITVPQSKYTYVAIEPAIIETPQLRDMGEATPPLEWMGLHRDKLPNVTHQIVIVPLLEFAKEVEGAYYHILGSSAVVGNAATNTNEIGRQQSNEEK